VCAKATRGKNLVVAHSISKNKFMSHKIFVGGLPFKMNDEDLQALAAGSANILSAKVVMDRETGRSRGFGFIEVATPEEMNAVIAALNGMDVDGRQISANEARPKEEGAGGNRGGFRRDR
jgi:cold-inducible RNA-binding protein